MTTKTPITVAHGDGIGPEIMGATLEILKAAGARLDIETIEIGEAVYNRGVLSGIEDSAWDSLRRTGIFLKAPITTPRGGGFKSLNVTIRKSMSQFANVRPCLTYDPAIPSAHEGMDVVIIRENEEDLYAGIEHRQTKDVYQTLKLISRPGCERICRYAFEYARANNRKKVTCMVKDNIMKLSDGMFRQVFEKVAEDYPEIESDNMIIDIGSAKVAVDPKRFDVIVTLNLYGDIISDIAAEITGSVGLCGSANIGEHCSMFEAIHGSAPDIAGQGIANPSGLLNGACMMLVHIGQGDVAEKVQNAWLKTLEDGIHTGDIYREGHSQMRVDTQGFTKAVIERLGQTPTKMALVDYTSGGAKAVEIKPLEQKDTSTKTLVGVDVFVDHPVCEPDELAKKLQQGDDEAIKLSMISNRGTAVWPSGQPETFLVDHWRCRFRGKDLTNSDVLGLLERLNEAGLDFIKTEQLYNFDDKAGYSKGQGED